MNSKLINFLLCLTASVLFTGCETVYTEHPMGTESAVLDEAAWQGTWISDEAVVLTTVLDAEKGQLQAAWVERGPDGARLESHSGVVRGSGSVFYLTMKMSDSEASKVVSGETKESFDPEAPTLYAWARVRLSGHKAVVWFPDVGQFSQAVGEQSLPGRVTEGGDVILAPLSEAHQARIDAPGNQLLQWSDPLVFVRIGD